MSALTETAWPLVVALPSIQSGKSATPRVPPPVLTTILVTVSDWVTAGGGAPTVSGTKVLVKVQVTSAPAGAVNALNVPGVPDSVTGPMPLSQLSVRA